MMALNPDQLCRQAKPHYYEFLSSDGHQLIPESIIHHIEQCANCLERVSRLEAALSEATVNFESEQSQIDSSVISMLKIHFAYVGTHVTCNTVKPLLPALLDPALKTRIPTPITAHLDNCEPCSEDLETIRGLNLNRKQLCRLSQLFAEKPPQNSAQCSEIGERTKSVAVMNFAGISTEALKHMCKCLVCRGVLYDERQGTCDSLSEYGQSLEFPCESIAATDIFDYVVPYGLDPASDQYAKFREPLISHLRSCRTCLAKMQQLHKTVYRISERPESDVATIFHIDESAKAQAGGEADELYAGFPISVEIRGREDKANPQQSLSTIDCSSALKQKASAMNLKLLARAAAVAAVILVAVALLLNAPTARAVTIEQIYRALERVENVHILKFVPNKTEPIEERWVSRSLSIYMSKTGEALVLYDLANRVRRTKESGTDTPQLAPLSDDIYDDIEKHIIGSLGLMPFHDMWEIPRDAQWTRATDDGLKTTTTDTNVYDLTWIEETHAGSVIFNKWRLFAGAETNLPQRVEWYQRLGTESEYCLSLVMVVEYLSDNEIQAVIRDAAL